MGRPSALSMKRNGGAASLRRTTAHRTTSRSDAHESLFRTLIATAVDGIVVINSKGTVRVFNAACEALFGYRADEVIGQNVKMLMPAPYYSEHDAYLENYGATAVRKIIGI